MSAYVSVMKNNNNDNSSSSAVAGRDTGHRMIPLSSIPLHPPFDGGGELDDDDDDDSSIIPNPHSAAHYFTLLERKNENKRPNAMDRMNRMAGRRGRRVSSSSSKHGLSRDRTLDDQQENQEHGNYSGVGALDDGILRSNTRYRRRPPSSWGSSIFKSFVGVVLAMGLSKLISYVWRVFLGRRFSEWVLKSALTGQDNLSILAGAVGGRGGGGVDYDNGNGVKMVSRVKMHSKGKGDDSDDGIDASDDARHGSGGNGLQMTVFNSNDDERSPSPLNGFPQLSRDVTQLKEMVQTVLEKKEKNDAVPKMSRSLIERSMASEVDSMQRDITGIRRLLQDIQQQLDRISHQQQQQRLQQNSTQVETSHAHTPKDVQVELAEIKGMLLGLSRFRDVQYVAQQPTSGPVMPLGQPSSREISGDAAAQYIPSSREVQHSERPAHNVSQQSYDDSYDAFDAAAAEYAQQQYTSVIGSGKQEKSNPHIHPVTPSASGIQEKMKELPDNSIADVYQKYTGAILGGTSEADEVGNQYRPNIETHYIVDGSEKSDDAQTGSADANNDKYGVDDSDDGIDITASDVSFEELFQRAMDAKHLNPFSPELSTVEAGELFQDDLIYVPGSMRASLNAHSAEREEDNEDNKLADIRRKTELARNSDSRLKNLKLFKFVDKLTSGALEISGNNTVQEKSIKGDVFSSIYGEVNAGTPSRTDKHEPIPDRKSLVDVISPNTFTMDSVIADIEKQVEEQQQQQQQQAPAISISAAEDDLFEKFEKYDFPSDERYRRFISFCEENGTLDNINEPQKEFAKLKLKGKFFSKYVEGAEQFAFHAYCNARNILEPEEDGSAQRDPDGEESVTEQDWTSPNPSAAELDQEQTLPQEPSQTGELTATDQDPAEDVEQNNNNNNNSNSINNEITNSTGQDISKEEPGLQQQDRDDTPPHASDYPQSQPPSQQQQQLKEKTGIPIKPSKRARRPKPWEIRNQSETKE